jgi:glycerol-3-phosphate dehydrogenase (NAD(P)+)
MKIAILGAGAWGTALAISLAGAHSVRLWTRSPEDCRRLARERISPYLEACPLPDSIVVEPDLAAGVAWSDLAIIATATAGLGAVARQVAGARPDASLLWACKGFDEAGGLLPHQVVAAALPGASEVGAFSGPSFALEVARAQPTAMVIASESEAFAARTATALNSPRLRIYSSRDVIGVEVGGAVKNVIAIAAGIADGLELGRNARAALVTRGLAEIVRLGVVLGGHADTFMGLTGLGDLVLTCTGDLSRNRQVGMELARGRSLDQALERLGHVSEGVRSARSVRELARRHRVDMPITQAICAVLEGALTPTHAVQQLLARDPKPE